MKKETKKLVIQMLREYHSLPERIRRREWEIKNPIREPDDNVGGGRAQNHRWTYYDNIVITLDEDRELNTLQKKYKVISECLDEAGEDTVTIIEGLYMKQYPETINGLITSGKLFCGQTRAYKLRDQFIVEVAKRLGLKYM